MIAEAGGKKSSWCSRSWTEAAVERGKLRTGHTRRAIPLQHCVACGSQTDFSIPELQRDAQLRPFLCLRPKTRERLLGQSHQDRKKAYLMRKAALKVRELASRNRRVSLAHYKGSRAKTIRHGCGKQGWLQQEHLMSCGDEDSWRFDFEDEHMEEYWSWLSDYNTAQSVVTGFMHERVAAKWRRSQNVLLKIDAFASSAATPTSPLLQSSPAAHVSLALPSNYLSIIGLNCARLVASFLSVHEYGALDSLASFVPGSVDRQSLLQSMVQLECVSEKLFRTYKEKGLSMHLSDKFLIPVWRNMADFAFRGQPANDGWVLAAPAVRPSDPSVADRETFCRRFQKRTGGVLCDIDWSNVCCLGGMVVGCLVADAADFKEYYTGLDVDLFLVGLSPEECKSKVAEIAASICASAVRLGVSAIAVWTPMTLTLNLRTAAGEALPNVQIVLGSWLNTTHLVFTSAEDCTAMAFNGSELLAAPRAREAVAHRQNLVRPEKYHLRGHWSTESRLLKYAARGFRAVDPGLELEKQNCFLQVNGNRVMDQVTRMVSRIEKELCKPAAGLRDLIRQAVSFTKAKQIAGAKLLLLAQTHPDLQQLLLHDAPLLQAGMTHEELTAVVETDVIDVHNSYGWRPPASKMRIVDSSSMDPEHMRQAVLKEAKLTDATNQRLDHPTIAWYAQLPVSWYKKPPMAHSIMMGDLGLLIDNSP